MHMYMYMYENPDYQRSFSSKQLIEIFEVALYFIPAMDMLYNIIPLLFIGEGKRGKEIDDKPSQYCFSGDL